ncbi:MAG: hypothetical protein QXQ14_02010 [Candidatus Aenigmatarchaeota archaeon]
MFHKAQVSILTYLLFSFLVFSLFTFLLYFWNTSIQVLKSQKSQAFLEYFKEALEFSGIAGYSVCNFCYFEIVLRTKTFSPRIYQPLLVYSKNQLIVYSLEDKEIYSSFYNLTNKYPIFAAATINKNILLNFSYFSEAFSILNVD